MSPQKILNQIEENISSVINRDSALGSYLWEEFLQIHPADIAQFLTNIEREHSQELFKNLPIELKINVFEYLSDSMKAFALSFLDDKDRIVLLESTSVEQLTDLFDYLSDEEIKHYFELLRKNVRERVLSLMKFEPESAGGIMDPYVFSLREDFTVGQSIQILQRLRPNQDLHQQIFVTDKENKLVGYIKLEDLVLKSPKTPLKSILRKNELVVTVHEDQEEIAKNMLHYHLTTVPVVSDGNYFLGVIPSETLVNIIEKEASEDVYRISAMTPIKQTYFETPFLRLFYERSYILIILLLAESFSSSILKSFEDTITVLLAFFIPMLISTGGNTSSQTSALTIQGLASGEINSSNIDRFLRREFFMSGMIAAVLGITGFIRVYLTSGNIINSAIVSLTLAIIVMTSIIMGSILPLILKRFKIDPAFSAGPVLATIMDILGILIYCYISKLFFAAF